MSLLSRFKAILCLSLIVIASQQLSFADVVSLDSDYVAGQALSTDKLNNDRHSLTDGVNNVRGVFAGSTQSSGQIKADTIGEENMADDANPRIRTGEGASCSDLVVSGFLPTTSSNLVLSIPSGVAYPDGYRVEKTNSTSETVNASKWTYYYILSSGSFDTNEVSIGASTPTAPANSAALFRASSDATTINTITDLRKTSCASGPFSAISDVTGESTLSDIFSNGQTNRRFSPAGRTPNGFINGFFVSWDTATTIRVTPGSAYINGKYRSSSQDTVVPITVDDPTNGVSGIVSGSPGASTTYNVYLVADKDTVKAPSVSFGTSASGLTNYRLIGTIKTDSGTAFISRDVLTVHGVNEKEVSGGWINLLGTGTAVINDAYNVSGFTDNGTGDYTVAWDVDYNSPYVAVAGSCYVSGTALYFANPGSTAPTAGVSRGQCNAVGAGATDATVFSLISFGDGRR